jgi:GTP-binding protein EngB required for normal cell division
MRSNGLKELILRGRKNGKSSGYNAFLFAIATERSVAKASIDPGRTFLLNPEDLRIMSTSKNKYTMDDSPD